MSVGIKVSEKGYNVHETSDDHIVYNSLYGNLMIAKMYNFNVYPHDVGGVPTYSFDFYKEHNLGYVPFVKLFYYVHDPGTGGWYEDKNSDLGWDNKVIKGTLSCGSPAYTYVIMLFSFDLENSTDFNFGVQTSQQYKLKKENFGIITQEKKEKNFSTNYSNLAITNVIEINSSIPTGESVYYSHGMKKIPFAEVFYQGTDGYWRHWDNNVGDYYAVGKKNVYLIATWTESKKSRIIIYGDSL